MKRLILATIGVIVTFAVVIYTAPPKKDAELEKNSLKTISKSGLPFNKVISPLHSHAPANNTVMTGKTSLQSLTDPHEKH